MNPLDCAGQVFDLELMNPNPSSSKTKDGPRYRISFEVQRETWDLFMEAETAGLLIAAKACVVGDVEGAEELETRKGEHSDTASSLHFSGFHLAPPVREVLGGDSAFLRWIRLQRCCCTEWSTGKPRHDGLVQAAHVRRIAAGAGTGIKPEYSAIPLCQSCHSLQHLQGESAIGGADVLEKRANRFVSEWAWSALALALDVDSMTQVSPAAIVAWAETKSVAHLLPAKIKSGAAQWQAI